MINADGFNELTVAEYLRLTNETLALMPSGTIKVVGEVVDYRLSQGKWVNFDLKDAAEEAKISCFTTAFAMRVPLENGLQVAVQGYPKVYERFGKFSLNVQSVELVGAGSLAKAYELLKKKFEAEGLFDVARKRGLPRFPQRIGLITSSDAAAYGDFLRVLGGRWNDVQIIHVPVAVQGRDAMGQIIAAFKTLQNLPAAERPELIVLTRGGGSLEDLHAFNDEFVARAVFQSTIPVVVAVGHERDESLCDFVADVRAATPTHAAQLVAPDAREVQREMQNMLDYAFGRLDYALIERGRRVDQALHSLERFIRRHLQDIQLVLERFRYSFERFTTNITTSRDQVTRLSAQNERAFLNYVDRQRQAFLANVRLLTQFDVQHVLKRGFSIIRKNGKLITGSSELPAGAAITIQLSDGQKGAHID